MVGLTANQVITRCGELKTFWNPRNDKMKDWYKLIQMVDELAQKNMESFVGNDPRASYNLVLSMLEQDIPHRIRSQELKQEQVVSASEVSRIFDAAWRDVYYDYRLRGRHWQRDFLGLLLATGWYAVFATMTLDGTKCIADIWNPASVYQNWEDTLVECAHVFTVSPNQANRMATMAGWKIDARSSMTVFDYWKFDGIVYNSVVMGSTMVKPLTSEPRFNRIPIFTAPAGGLPDTGLLSSDVADWKKDMGQSLVASNENIYRSWNKAWTFLMQILRDTAQPRWVEKSASAVRMVKPEDVFKYGPIFKLGLQDSFGPVQMPPLPTELRTSLLDMEAMLQRGGPSWASYGSVQQQLSSYVMSQISASLRNVAKPFHDATIDMFTDVDNFWFDLMQTYNYKPYNFPIPKDLSADIRLTADYEIKIPGDLIQRATAARMLDPGFEISPNRVMEELFPEIRNPTEELARIRAAKAERHPIRALIALIASFREEARILRNVRDLSGAALYEKAAARAEAMLGVEEGEIGPTRGAPRAGPEVVPPPSPTSP